MKSARITQTATSNLSESGFAAAIPDITSLSKRERQVADLVVFGYTNRGIAAHLKIAEGTVSSHVKNIFTKLAIHSRSELAAWIAVIIGSASL